MKKSVRTLMQLAVALTATTASLCEARTVTLELTNLTHGMYFTPRLAAAHGAEFSIFQVGEAASPGLRTMAETGSPMVLAGEVPESAVFAVDVNGDSPTIQDGVPRILSPGSSSTITLEDVPDDGVLLSLGAMLMPTNDAFVGMDSFAVPDGAGNYEMFLNAYDAGTEANTELVLPEPLRAIPECSSNADEENASCNNNSYVPFHPDASQSGFFAVGSDGSGVVSASSAETSVVHIHAGIIGDFENTGGASDLNSSFHRWLNPVGRIRITVAE